MIAAWRVPEHRDANHSARVAQRTESGLQAHPPLSLLGSIKCILALFLVCPWRARYLLSSARFVIPGCPGQRRFVSAIPTERVQKGLVDWTSRKAIAKISPLVLRWRNASPSPITGTRIVWSW